MPIPKNIILIVVDSLRFDSAYQDGHLGMEYTEKNGIEFKNIRSGGCWTLPSTASIFTGLMPHQHQATSQTRKIPNEIPTLAEKLSAHGYDPVQITGNMVTTGIFGVDRGFRETFKIWNFVKPRLQQTARFIMMLSRPRIRKELLAGTLVLDKVSQYLKAGNVWAQTTHQDIFDMTRKVLAENSAKKQKSFFFLNLMEAHFPYHVHDTFQFEGNRLDEKLQELTGLYHTVNQSFLKKDKFYIKPRAQRILHRRQRKAWRLLRKNLDAFIQELHQDKDNLVIFCADHGENFGDQGWFYHFSNVTDGGNRVPLVWLGHDHPKSRTENKAKSLTSVHNSILSACDIPNDGGTLFDNRPQAIPVLQSYWYNNFDKTLQKYKYNQFCFVRDDQRYVLRNKDWFYAPVGLNAQEPDFEPLGADIDPLEELIDDAEEQAWLRQSVSEFNQFSGQVLP